MDARVFISNNWCRGKSKTVKRQKERERVRDRALLEERDSTSNKIHRWRKHVAQVSEIN